MDVYEKLQRLLDTHISGAPKSKNFDEILRILFGEQEARVALGLKFVPRSVPEIAASAEVPQDEARRLLAAMADRAVIFSREKNGETGYALLPTVPGLFEFPLMSGEMLPVHQRLAKLWTAYHAEALSASFAATPTAVARIIPIEQSVAASNKVMPYDELSRMLDLCTTFAVAHCACRMSVGKCDAPKDVCMIFDVPARFLIERKIAKEITKSQAKEILIKAEQAGLVHTTSNSQDRLNFVCNCCPCCCTILRGLTELNNPNAFAKSRWEAFIDADACTGCGACADKRCPMGAISLEGGLARADTSRCIGCGLCASVCPAGAVSMKLREKASEPPKTLTEMGLTVAREKGVLDKFVAMMRS